MVTVVVECNCFLASYKTTRHPNLPRIVPWSSPADIGNQEITSPADKIWNCVGDATQCVKAGVLAYFSMRSCPVARAHVLWLMESATVHLSSAMQGSSWKSCRSRSLTASAVGRRGVRRSRLAKGHLRLGTARSGSGVWNTCWRGTSRWLEGRLLWTAHLHREMHRIYSLWQLRD